MNNQFNQFNQLIINDKKTLVYNNLYKIIGLDIEPFHMCNYNCSYCYLGKKDKKEINYKALYYFLEKKFIPGLKKIF